jgi:hypothetical protein
VLLFLGLSSSYLCAQEGQQRAFPQSKAEVEKALDAMQSSMSGRLPTLDGFANSGDHPLDQYQRGFFQASADVAAIAAGTLVRVKAKITAWHSDPVASRSGYQLLTSNGRIESDLLDQLADQLAGKTTNNPPAKPAEAVDVDKDRQPPASASNRTFPDASTRFSASSNAVASDRATERPAGPEGDTKSNSTLQAETNSLEEILKNTAQPKNLVAVKKSGTPVVATPSLNAKLEFLASMHDEFEMLDFNADWVHVRISGISRGWIWRNSVEMPEGIPNTEARPAAVLAPAADLFSVSREENAQFPGDWVPLRDKSVKIISVQKVGGSKDAGPSERLAFVKFLLQQNYAELAKEAQKLSGLVVIFDSADGGMVAATTETLQQWKTGALSDAALWHACFFDPPETFDSSPPSVNK